MFNLDKAIAEWRRQMTAAGIGTPAVLNELENHLRDDIDEQVRSGVGPQEAFAAAVQRIGSVELLKNEFAKTQSKRFLARWPASLKLAVYMFAVGVLFVTGFSAGRSAELIGTVAVAVLILFAWRYAARRSSAAPRIRPLAPDTTHTLDIARQEASRYHHDFVGTEHLLLALLETGVVRDVLQRLGVKRDAVRIEVEHLVGPNPERSIASTLPCTPRARRALRLAADEAKAMRHSQVRPECLFLGLLLEGTGVAALALKNLGLDSQRARAEILKTSQNGG